MNKKKIMVMHYSIMSLICTRAPLKYVPLHFFFHYWYDSTSIQCRHNAPKIFTSRVKKVSPTFMWSLANMSSIPFVFWNRCSTLFFPSSSSAVVRNLSMSVIWSFIRPNVRKMLCLANPNRLRGLTRPPVGLIETGLCVILDTVLDF